MKRDMDLIRQILFKIEADQYCNKEINIELDGHYEDEIMYHVMLLHDAGLIEALKDPSISAFRWVPLNLTWEGHEFIEAARSDDTWDKAKAIISEKGGGLVFDVLKKLLIKLISDQVMAT